MKSGGEDGKTERQSEQLWKWGFERQMVCVLERGEKRERGNWHFGFVLNF